MLLVRALLLWALVSVHVAGAAILFRRLFRHESEWFALIVPALAFCVGLNFLEHFVAVPSLLGLLPFTTAGSIVLILRPNLDAAGWWRRVILRRDLDSSAAVASDPQVSLTRDLKLPFGIFLGFFAFTFFIRCLDPNILASSDGMADLNLVANFCKGDTLPPTDGWMPPFKLEYYYTFQHYAASVVTRLLGVDVGTGCNVAHALLSAFTCVVAAAVAWRLTGRVWITILMPLVVLGAATGSSAYLLLTEPDPSPWVMSNVVGGLEHPDHNPIWKLLATAPYRERLELQVPGFWIWRGEYHPNAGGHFLSLCALWALVELFIPQRRNWPWIAAGLVPFLAIITSTWALPITALLCGGGLAAAWWTKRRPENATFVWIALVIGLVGIWPTLLPLFSAPESPPVIWNKPEYRTPLYEFLIQWWPIILLWLTLLVFWRRLPLEVKWAHAVVPLMLLGIEFINIEDGRYNTVEKMWGYTFGVGLVAFLPVVAARRGMANRLVMGVIVLSSFIAFLGWMRGFKWADWHNNVWHLEGNGMLRLDPQRARLLEAVSQLHKATLLTGKVIWAYNDSPALATFSGNRAYIAWTWSETRYGHGGETDFRADQVNDFYAGKDADPLAFLLGHGISGVVIWPDDQISDAQLAAFKQQIGTRFSYIDCRGDGPHNAGLFLQQSGAAREGHDPGS